jgi:alpha,alpha-trehalose phosphorylase
VAGFGGMRDYGETLSFAPRLPPRLTGLSFGLLYRGRRLRVDVQGDEASYTLLDGEPLDLIHHGEQITVSQGSMTSRPVPPAPRRLEPRQPPGREPAVDLGDFHALPQATHGG